VYKISFNNDSEEIMVIAPNGHVRFLGMLETLKFMWSLVRNRESFILNDELIEAKKKTS